MNVNQHTPNLVPNKNANIPLRSTAHAGTRERRTVVQRSVTRLSRGGDDIPGGRVRQSSDDLYGRRRSRLSTGDVRSRSLHLAENVRRRLGESSACV